MDVRPLVPTTRIRRRRRRRHKLVVAADFFSSALMSAAARFCPRGMYCCCYLFIWESKKQRKKGELPVLGAAAWTCCGNMWYVASCGTINT
jgi:hypothetical protein